jgi:protein involved in polysaccharide export with SLBB domain
MEWHKLTDMNKKQPLSFSALCVFSVALTVFGQVASAQSGAAGRAASVGRATTSSGLGTATTGAAPGLSLGAPAAPQNLGTNPSAKRADGKADKTLPVLLGQSGHLPSQFQVFVYENTGKLLPMYGAHLFNNAQTYAEDTAALPPPEHLLGPGDEVNVQLWGVVEYSGAHTLDRYGQITLPKIGTFSLQGVTVRDLETALRKQVSRVYLSGVTVTATMGKARGATVYVVGHAKRPGTYNVSTLSTLLNVLFASGGPSTQGSMRDIRLIRRGKVLTQLDLYDLIAKGNKSQDMTVESGDLIMIPGIGPRVAVTGAYDHEAIYEIKPGETISDVLSKGAGVPVLVSTGKALLERIQPEDNMPRKVAELTLGKEGLALPMQDGDILTLLQISPEFANAVTLQGSVAQQLRHVWTPGMRVNDVIPDRDALITGDYYKRKNALVQNIENELAAGEYANRVAARVRSGIDEINWEYAVIERFNKLTMRPDLLPFNLGRAVMEKDPAHNLELQVGDVITILSAADLQRPVSRGARVVRLEGEVQTPGIYQFEVGETLRQIVNRAGGLTPQAYLFGSEFTRDTVRAQQQKNIADLIRKMEDQKRNVAEKMIANAGERTDQVRAKLELQNDNLAAQIQRLNELRSKGRVTLEMDALQTLQANNKLALLPDLTLEDGDRLLVPATPAFVSAIGHVNNENPLLYKRGVTVAQVLDRSGVIEGADESEIFVLRADGSVVNKRRTGIWGSLERLELMPGDTVIVPTKADRETWYNIGIRALKDWSQILLNFGLGAAAFKALN